MNETEKEKTFYLPLEFFQKKVSFFLSVLSLYAFRRIFKANKEQADTNICGKKRPYFVINILIDNRIFRNVL